MQVIIKDAVTAVIDEIGAKLRQKKPVAEAMGLAVVAMTIRSFNDPSLRASPWAPLTERTIAAKIAEGTSTAILKRHGLLWRSWRITAVTNDFVKVGTDRFYAAFHQFGTKRGLPARPMLPIEGGPDDARFTPLAIQRMAAVARAALAGLLLPKKRRKPPPPQP